MIFKPARTERTKGTKLREASTERGFAISLPSDLLTGVDGWTLLPRAVRTGIPAIVKVVSGEHTHEHTSHHVSEAHKSPVNPPEGPFVASTDS